MTAIESRLRENYPPILMTLVSLIVALIFENLISELGSRQAIWRVTPENFFLWAQSVFLGASTMYFWFTQSLHAAAVRVVFSPRDVFGAVGSGLFFFLLAANLGAEGGIVWMYAAAALYTVAWYAITDYGRLYAADPDASGGVGAHRSSSRLMLAGATIVGCGGLLGTFGVVGIGGVAGFLVVAVVLGGLAHALWFSEFKSAVGLRQPNTLTGEA